MTVKMLNVQPLAQQKTCFETLSHSVLVWAWDLHLFSICSLQLDAFITLSNRRVYERLTGDFGLRFIDIIMFRNWSNSSCQTVNWTAFRNLIVFSFQNKNSLGNWSTLTGFKLQLRKQQFLVKLICAHCKNDTITIVDYDYNLIWKYSFLETWKLS